MIKSTLSPVTTAVVTRRGPYGRDNGQQFVAAIPNAAGLKGATSYAPPYLVYEGIYTSPADRERHRAVLQSMGFAA